MSGPTIEKLCELIKTNQELYSKPARTPIGIFADFLRNIGKSAILVRESVIDDAGIIHPLPICSAIAC